MKISVQLMKISCRTCFMQAKYVFMLIRHKSEKLIDQLLEFVREHWLNWESGYNSHLFVSVGVYMRILKLKSPLPVPSSLNTVLISSQLLLSVFPKQGWGLGVSPCSSDLVWQALGGSKEDMQKSAVQHKVKQSFTAGKALQLIPQNCSRVFL